MGGLPGSRDSGDGLEVLVVDVHATDADDGQKEPSVERTGGTGWLMESEQA